jgi:hypothetical protein
MENIKDIVVRKAHESSLKRINVKEVPPTLVKYLSLEFLNSIADCLTAVTRAAFLYTGKLQTDKNQIIVSFVSSDKKDVIDMLIKYNYKENEGFDFVNLNNYLERSLEKPKEVETPEVPQITQAKADEFHKDLKVAIKQDKPIEKPQSPKINPQQILTTLDKELKKDEEEKAKEQGKKLLNLMNSMVTKMETKDKANKMLNVLEKMVEIEDDD